MFPVVIPLQAELIFDRTAAEDRVGDTIRPEIDVDAIEMNLRAGDERTEETQGLSIAFRHNGFDDVGRGGERAFDNRRAAPLGRQRFRDGVDIGEERFDAFDDQAFEFAGRQALSMTALSVGPHVSDQPA